MELELNHGLADRQTVSGCGDVVMDTDNRMLDLILKGIDDLRGDVQGLRAELTAGDEKRVSKDAYEQYQKATEERLGRLEASPMRMLAWMGFFGGVVGGPLLNAAMFVFTHR